MLWRHGSVLEYAMLAINISLLQHSHLKPDTLDRKGRILWARSRLYSPVSSKAARSRHYYLAKSARLRHYHLASDHKWNERSTDISLLISIHTIHRAVKRALSTKINVVMTFVFRRWSGKQLRPSRVVDGMPRPAGRFHYNLGTSRGPDKIGSRAGPGPRAASCTWLA